MADFSINPIAEYVILTFNCSACGTENQTDALVVPIPDYSAENHRESINSEDYEHECETCGTLFNISLYNGIYGGTGEILDLDDENILKVEEEFPDEDIDYDNLKYFDTNVKDTVEVLDKIDSLDLASRKLLYRTLFANIISSMEAYLSDRLIKKVLSTEKYKRLFTEKYKDFQDEKIKLSNLFSTFDNIDSLISNSLRDVIYHNLPKVQHIYKSVLNIDLGNEDDVKELMQAIGIRHDIVHRNGKDKNGNMREISKEDVVNLAHKVSNFIVAIELKFEFIKFNDKK